MHNLLKQINFILTYYTHVQIKKDLIYNYFSLIHSLVQTIIDITETANSARRNDKNYRVAIATRQLIKGRENWERKRALPLTLINHPRRVVELLESDELSPPEEPASAIYDPPYLPTIVLLRRERQYANDIRSRDVINARLARCV